MGTIILENLIPLVVAVLTPVFLVLVRGLMVAAAKKWHLDGALKYEAKVEALVLKGIKAAEKKSMTAVKRGDKDDKTHGEEKLAMVLEFVNSTLKANGLPEKGGKELAMLIEAKLFDGGEINALAGDGK